jgi:hypothetical protein
LYFVNFDPVYSSYAVDISGVLIISHTIYVLGRDCLNEDSLNICFRNIPCPFSILTANEHLIQQKGQEKHPAAHLKSIFKREGTPMRKQQSDGAQLPRLVCA